MRALILMTILAIGSICKAQGVSLMLLDQDSKEPISNALVHLGSTIKFTDNEGVVLFNDTASVIYIDHLNYKDTLISGKNEGFYTVYLKRDYNKIVPVFVKARRPIESIMPQEVAKTPQLFATPDLINYIQTLPGVSNVQEGNNGLFVRGGRSDENLIILDDAVIFNPNHLFGLISSFNTSAISSLSFYDQGIPIHFGNRNASVLDIHTKNGNNEKHEHSVALNILGLDLSSNGRILSNKLTYNFAYRTSFTNLIRPLTNLDMGFYDVNAKLYYRHSSRTSYSASFYRSKDYYSQSIEDQAFMLLANEHIWSNTALSIRSQSMTKNNMVIRSAYSFSTLDNYKSANELNVKNRQLRQKLNVQHFKIRLSKELRLLGLLDLGVDAYAYSSTRDLINHSGNISAKWRDNSIELSPFVGITKLYKKVSLTAGIRPNIYFVDNQASLYPDTRVKVEFESGKHKLFVSFDQSSQFVFQLNETFMPLSSDFWLLSSEDLKPQRSSMLNLGYKFQSDRLSILPSIYYKEYNQTYDYKDGAILYDGQDPISQLTAAHKFSQAAQIKVEYELEKLNIVFNYTLSKTRVQADSLNSGQAYPSYSDRPHLLNLGLNIKLSDRWTVSLKQYLQSGRPLTLLYSARWLFI